MATLPHGSVALTALTARPRGPRRLTSALLLLLRCDYPPGGVHGRERCSSCWSHCSSLILAVALVRRLLGIERGTVGRHGAGRPGRGSAARSWYWGPGSDNIRDLPPRAAFGAYALVTVFTMLGIVVVELVAGPHAAGDCGASPTRSGATRRLAGRTVRYVKVSAMAVRHGLLRSRRVTTSRCEAPGWASALSATFEDAGGLFVKLGQAMAAQPHLVTRAVAAELARLQDQAAPADPAAARAVIDEELGPPEEIFAELSAEPIGSASIAQTYVARLKGGREVVVKVQRPGVRESIEQDLDILARLTQSPRPADHVGAIARTEGARCGLRRAHARGARLPHRSQRTRPRSDAPSATRIRSACPR